MPCWLQSRIGLPKRKSRLSLSIDASDGAGISWLHRNTEVLEKQL